jgi:hypothetical protein
VFRPHSPRNPIVDAVADLPNALHLAPQEVRSLIEIQREAEELQKLSDQANAKLTSLNNEYAKATVAETSNTTRIEVSRSDSLSQQPIMSARH